MVSQTQERCIVVNSWYNKNNATDNVFITHRPYIRIWGNVICQRTGRMWYGSILYAAVYNKCDWVRIRSKFIVNWYKYGMSWTLVDTNTERFLVKRKWDGKTIYLGVGKVYFLINNINLYEIIVCTQCLGTYRTTGWSHYKQQYQNWDLIQEIDQAIDEKTGDKYGDGKYSTTKKNLHLCTNSP